MEFISPFSASTVLSIEDRERLCGGTANNRMVDILSTGCQEVLHGLVQYLCTTEPYASSTCAMGSMTVEGSEVETWLKTAVQAMPDSSPERQELEMHWECGVQYLYDCMQRTNVERTHVGRPSFVSLKHDGRDVMMIHGSNDNTNKSLSIEGEDVLLRQMQSLVQRLMQSTSSRSPWAQNETTRIIFEDIFLVLHEWQLQPKRQDSVQFKLLHEKVQRVLEWTRWQQHEDNMTHRVLMARLLVWHMYLAGPLVMHPEFRRCKCASTTNVAVESECEEETSSSEDDEEESDAFQCTAVEQLLSYAQESVEHALDVFIALHRMTSDEGKENAKKMEQKYPILQQWREHRVYPRLAAQLQGKSQTLTVCSSPRYFMQWMMLSKCMNELHSSSYTRTTLPSRVPSAFVPLFQNLQPEELQLSDTQWKHFKQHVSTPMVWMSLTIESMEKIFQLLDQPHHQKSNTAPTTAHLVEESTFPLFYSDTKGSDDDEKNHSSPTNSMITDVSENEEEEKDDRHRPTSKPRLH